MSARRGPAASPLLGILADGVTAGEIVKHPSEEVYSGFGTFGQLKTSHCEFVAMNSNRVVNQEVVERRVAANLKSLKDLGKYLDFGELTLLVQRMHPGREFYIMDGQHRIATMNRLYDKHRDQALVFHFRIVVVATEAEAHEALMHFQDCFPADPRAFFATQGETKLATAVVDKLHERYPGAFKESKLGSRMGGGHTADPQRPYLNDYILFWLLKESGLLSRRHADRGSVLRGLEAMNTALGSASRAELGDQATENMRGVATTACGCAIPAFPSSPPSRQRFSHRHSTAMHLIVISSHLLHVGPLQWLLARFPPGHEAAVGRGLVALGRRAARCNLRSSSESVACRWRLGERWRWRRWR